MHRLYTQSVLDLGFIARPIYPMATLKFLAIDRLSRVISPCHGINMTHTKLLNLKRFGYIVSVPKGSIPEKDPIVTLAPTSLCQNQI